MSASPSHFQPHRLLLLCLLNELLAAFALAQHLPGPCSSQAALPVWNVLSLPAENPHKSGCGAGHGGVIPTPLEQVGRSAASAAAEAHRPASLEHTAQQKQERPCYETPKPPR